MVPLQRVDLLILAKENRFAIQQQQSNCLSKKLVGLIVWANPTFQIRDLPDDAQTKANTTLAHVNLHNLKWPSHASEFVFFLHNSGLGWN